MLRGIIISPDRDLAEQLEEALSECGNIAVLRTISNYPSVIDLIRIIRAHAPQVIFLAVDSIEQALATATTAEAHFPGIQCAAISHGTNPEALLRLMRVGIREFIPAPFVYEELRGAVTRIEESLERRPLAPFESEYLYSFLPAKPGVGASTIAMNVAAAAARIFKLRTLLADLDLNSGMQRFMLRLDNEFSITDAAESAFKMDEAMWPQLVSTVDNMDVLHSGRLNPGYRIEPSQMRHLVEFMRRYYQLLCVDLSGNMEKYSVEIMHESRRIFLVTTSEISSLHLARERYSYLRSLELGDRVQLILNRHHKGAAIGKSQVEDLLGLPVSMAFPNNYQSIHRALADAKPVEADSDLGRLFSRMAHSLLDREPEAEIPEVVAPLQKVRRGAFSSLFSMWGD